MAKWLWIFGALSISAAQCNAASMCFKLYDQRGRQVYRSSAPPVDLSLKLSDALASRYPRHQLVFGPEGDCHDPDAIAAEPADGSVTIGFSSGLVGSTRGGPLPGQKHSPAPTPKRQLH